MPSTTFSAAPLKGSWEAQLTEAERLARNFNDACLPIFDKLYTRLGKMPKARRMAADERLQNIFMRAADSYQGYLLMREQYDRALEVIERMEEELEDEEALDWSYHVILALHQAGRDEEAIERLRPQPDLPIRDALNEWGSFATFLISIDRLDEGEAILEHTTTLVAESTELDERKRQVEFAYIAMHRARLALGRQAWEESVFWFDEAVSWNEDSLAGIGEIYQPIAMEGPPALALRLIERDERKNVGRFFWRGVAHLRAGEEGKAQRDWERVITAEPDADDHASLYETILAAYYLGDPGRAGLTSVLQTLQEKDPQNWALMILAGLGWAIQGNMTSAYSNLGIAMLLRRMTRPGGKHLPEELWPHAQLLLDEDNLREVAPYFGVEMNQDASEDEEVDVEGADGENEEEAG
jgi:tetratricopeptide (TPR) repeat protein